MATADTTTPGELLAEYVEQYPPDDIETVAGGFDSAEPFLLVEKSRYDGYFLTMHSDLESAADYHDNQEYAEDWEILMVVDLRDATRYDSSTKLVTTFTKETT